MGLPQYCSYISSLVVLYSLLANPSCSLNRKSVNASKVLQNEGQWKSVAATLYGDPHGAGTDGGSCGYGFAVEIPPFNKMVSAVGPSLYNCGKGCGACYQMKWTANATCSGNPVTVVTTDSCPGCSRQDHFDRSGTAFGAIAKPGQADNLRNVGLLQVLYKRVACNYGVSIAFKVDYGSNPYYFAMVIEYENGDSDLSAVELKQAQPSDPWLPMQESWGAVWKLNSGSPLRAPYQAHRGANKIVVANNVIPAGWTPGNTYRSAVNFRPPVHA